MKFKTTAGKKSPVNPAYLPIKTRLPLTEEQRNAVLAACVSLDETEDGLAAPNGFYCYVVKFNPIREEYAALQKACQEHGLELMIPPSTAPGVSFIPFKKG